MPAPPRAPAKRTSIGASNLGGAVIVAGESAPAKGRPSPPQQKAPVQAPAKKASPMGARKRARLSDSDDDSDDDDDDDEEETSLLDADDELVDDAAAEADTT